MKASSNNYSYPRQQASAGFTLIELMVTIAVLAIIVGIAAPNISTQLANQRIKSTAATLENALKEAKVESVIRRQIMTVSVDNNGTNAGTVVIENANASTVASYTYNSKSTINAADSETDFGPNKTAGEMTYTVCDTNTGATPYQVTVSAAANITSTSGGNC